MTVSPLTAASFEAIIVEGIQEANASLDLVTEIRDLAVVGQAKALERVHEDVRKVSALQSLQNLDEFEDLASDLEAVVYNEEVTRLPGAAPGVTLVFSRSTPPTADIQVARGYPVGTTADESSGSSRVFVTTESAVMLAAQAASYYDIDSNSYQLRVPAVALTAGGTVGARRVTRPLRPLVGFGTVTNLSAATGGSTAETDSEMVERYFLSLRGRRLGTETGLARFVRDEFVEVTGVAVVGGTVETERAEDDAGAVDVFLQGDQSLNVTEVVTFRQRGQLITPDLLPLMSVESVTDGSGAAYVEDTDYEVVWVADGLLGSEREHSGVRFKFTGAAPAAGDPVIVTYSYDNLVRRVQTTLTSSDNLCLGRDVLVRRGVEVPIAHTANLRVAAGFNSASVQAAVEAAVENLFATYELGSPVEESDIQGVVRLISGVDNYVITRLSRVDVPSAVGDVTLGAYEYPTLSVTDFAVTLI